MMTFDWAAISRAARHRTRGPGGCSEWRVEGRNRQQAKPGRGSSQAFALPITHKGSVLVLHDTPNEHQGGLGIQTHVKRPGSITFYIWIELRRLSSLDLTSGASQTRFMAHTYLLFDFGNAEEKAQQARHKLDVWKQTFRLDKKLTYKFDRIAAAAADAPEPAQKVEPESKSAKGKGKGKSREKSSGAAPAIKEQPANGKVNLLVKLYFSTHEKLSEQRWVERIPTEEPFKDAAPRVVRQTDAQFDDVLKQFDALV